MIIPGPVLPWQQPWLCLAPPPPPPPSRSNPAQIRYDHHTEQLNPAGLCHGTRRAAENDAQIQLQTGADPPHNSGGCFHPTPPYPSPLCRLQTKCLFSVRQNREKKRKVGGKGSRRQGGERREKKDKKKEEEQCQIPLQLLPNRAR